jgi:tricorn protease
LYRSGETWIITGTDAPPKPGDGKITVDLRMQLEPRAEWRQIFREAWRYERDYLYVPNHHGADWDKVYAMYEPWLAHVSHRSDLTYLLDLLGGELSLGHTFVFGGDTPAIDTVKIGLLGADFAVDQGATACGGSTRENWNPGLRAPFPRRGEGAHWGLPPRRERRGAEAADEPLRGPRGHRRPADSAAAQRPADARGLVDGAVVPVANDNGLRTQAWVEGNRRLVDSLSGGRLAYVWIPNTGDDGYTNFNRYYFAQQSRQGVILDERFNGGGYIAGLRGPAPRLRGCFIQSGGRAPSVDRAAHRHLQSQSDVDQQYAGSGGDMLPYLFREMEPTLVGTRTWGGLVGIWDVPE